MYRTGMMKIGVTERWQQSFPGGHVGLLLVGGVDNSGRPAALEARKLEIVTALRRQYKGTTRADLLELPVLQAYRDYYKQFRKTYHVQLQLESILYKGKNLPAINPLVDANFMAEMETLILSAGHDAGRLEPPVTIDATDGSETFLQLSGARKRLKAGDMAMKDADGVVCTIIYGQDRRTPISPATTRALYVAYIPPGISQDATRTHLEAIKRNVQLFAPAAEIELQTLINAEKFV